MMIKRLVISLRLLTCQSTGTPLNKQQDINGYSILDTKSMTGNRLVLVLRVVEP